MLGESFHAINVIQESVLLVERENLLDDYVLTPFLFFYIFYLPQQLEELSSRERKMLSFLSWLLGPSPHGSGAIEAYFGAVGRCLLALQWTKPVISTLLA